MAKGVWQNTIRDSGGRVQPGAAVVVLDSVTQAPRPIYADRDGLVTISGDGVTQTDAYGFVRFYTAIGRVDIQLAAGGRTQLLSQVVIIDDFPG